MEGSVNQMGRDPQAENHCSRTTGPAVYKRIQPASSSYSGRKWTKTLSNDMANRYYFGAHDITQLEQSLPGTVQRKTEMDRQGQSPLLHFQRPVSVGRVRIA